MDIYPTGMERISFNSTPRSEPLKIYRKLPSSTRNLIAVTISLHSCTSSKNIKVFPFSIGTSVNADIRSKMSLLSEAFSKSVTADGISRKLISMTYGKFSFANSLIQYVLPTCLAPVIINADFFSV